MMKSLLMLLGISVLLTTACLAQEFSRVDIYGGYSYLNIDTNHFSSCQSVQCDIEKAHEH